MQILCYLCGFCQVNLGLYMCQKAKAEKSWNQGWRPRNGCTFLMIIDILILLPSCHLWFYYFSSWLLGTTYFSQLGCFCYRYHLTLHECSIRIYVTVLLEYLIISCWVHTPVFHINSLLLFCNYARFTLWKTILKPIFNW